MRSPASAWTRPYRSKSADWRLPRNQPGPEAHGGIWGEWRKPVSRENRAAVIGGRVYGPDGGRVKTGDGREEGEKAEKAETPKYGEAEKAETPIGWKSIAAGGGPPYSGRANGKRTPKPNPVDWAQRALGGGMSLWAFRFLLWYICVLLVQPQNRFTFLWPLHIADLTFIAAIGLHVMGCLEGRQTLVRFGPGTVWALALLFFATLSQHFGTYQLSPAWNAYLDIIVKNALLLIMVEAMAISIERVWAVQMTMLICTLWWIKGGLRLSALGATYAGDRLQGAAISLIENPNGFAYMMCVFLPLYLYAYQRAAKPWQRWAFLACALAAVWIVFETGSRTGMVALIAVGFFLLPHYGRHRWKTVVMVIVAVTFLYPLTGEKNRDRFRTIPQSVAAFFGDGSAREPGPMSQDEQSADERQAKNRDTWALIKENFLFGVGVNPDQSRFTDRFPMAGGQVHCEILMAGRQMGMIGMGMYVGFIALVFFGGWRVRREAANWPAVRDLGWTFQIQAVAIAVGGAFSPLPWHAPMMLLAGSVSALVQVLKAERAAHPQGRAGY